MRRWLLVSIFLLMCAPDPASAQGVYQGCPINVSPYVRCGNTIVSTSTGIGVTPNYGYLQPTYFSYGTSNYSYQPYVVPQQTYFVPQYVQPAPSGFGLSTFSSAPLQNFGVSTFSSAPLQNSGISRFSSPPLGGFGTSTFSSAPAVHFGTATTVQTFSGAPSFGTYNAAVYGASNGVRIRGRRH